MLTIFLISSEVSAETSGVLEPDKEFDASQAFGPGDVKQGYESEDYVTNSRSLLERRGTRINLIEIARNPPLGLPAVAIPADNPITPEKIDLGRKLFFDKRLSINNTISCASCHIPEQGFTNNEISTAVGVEGRSVLRNAPTISTRPIRSIYFLMDER